LRTEAAARLFYVAYLDLHAHLQWSTRGAAVPATQEPVVPGSRPRAGRRAALLAVAASLVAAGVLVVLLLRRHGPEEEPPDLPEAAPGSVAVLIHNRNTVWEDDMTLPTRTGSALPPGRLRLKEGVVQIAFHGGGEVLLEGPADFDIRTADEAVLRRGKLSVQVPDGAQALRIRMPDMVVIDRGGECGLLSENGHAEVHVFTGHVEADPIDGQGEPLPGRRLAENAGARVDPGSRTLTAVQLNEQTFAHLRPEIRVVDAAVRGGQFAGRNFGTADRLVVKNSIADYTWETYLRFDLSGVKGKVATATVRLVPLRVGQPLDNAAALVSDNTWSETGITWDNKPSSGAFVARWTIEAAGKPIEFDVTRQVQEALAADRKLSLRLFAPERKRGSAYVEYGSRRGEAESRPQLSVTLAP
jgi:hypothetical protein